MPEQKSVNFLLAPLPTFTILPFSAFVDKLRLSADDEDYSRQRFCHWQVIGLNHEYITSSSNINIQTDVTMQDINIKDYHYLVLFGGRDIQIMQSLKKCYSPLIKKAKAAGLKIVCIDNACFLLAEMGLLDTQEVVIHWRHYHEFKTLYPHINAKIDRLYQIDKTCISCSGGLAAIELAIHLLSFHLDKTKALKGLPDMLIDQIRDQHYKQKLLNESNIIDKKLSHAIDLMHNMFSNKITIEQFSRLIGISRRQLDRLFITSFNQTAYEYWLDTKLQHAHWRLLNTHHTIDVIAQEVGIQDNHYFGILFKKKFNVTPSQLRKTRLIK